MNYFRCSQNISITKACSAGETLHGAVSQLEGGAVTQLQSPLLAFLSYLSWARKEEAKKQLRRSQPRDTGPLKFNHKSTECLPSFLHMNSVPI